MSPDEIEDRQSIYGGWERETRAFASNGDPRRAGATMPTRWMRSARAFAAPKRRAPTGES
jgi:hypothetical protein